MTLKKSPTLGLGITGGKDGENAIKPGDKVLTDTIDGMNLYKVTVATIHFMNYLMQWLQLVTFFN